MLAETFHLYEGPVTVEFPSALSEDSYEELESYLQLFLRQAKRRAASLRMMMEDANKGDWHH
jgi:hypothetical protein